MCWPLNFRFICQVFLEFAREQDDDRTGGQDNLASESEEGQREAGGHVAV